MGPRQWREGAANTFNNIERVYSRAIAFSNRRCSVPLESAEIGTRGILNALLRLTWTQSPLFPSPSFLFSSFVFSLPFASPPPRLLPYTPLPSLPSPSSIPSYLPQTLSLPHQIHPHSSSTIQLTRHSLVSHIYLLSCKGTTHCHSVIALYQTTISY